MFLVVDQKINIARAGILTRGLRQSHYDFTIEIELVQLQWLSELFERDNITPEQ